MKNKLKVVHYRRKRSGKTDYKQRINLLKSGKPRMVVRPSVNKILIQIITYEEKGDKVLASATSKELEKLGWNASLSNTPAAYLTGMLIAKKAADKKIGECIFDIGLIRSVKGSKVFAALKGAVDNGLNVPMTEKVVPDEKRISGKHIEEYAKKLKQENKEKYEKQFSGYLKAGVSPENISKIFDDTKKRIAGK